MKILGMEIPPKGKKNNSNIESAPVLPEALTGLWEKCEEYLGAREKFAQTLRNGTALDQVQALKNLQDTTKIYAGEQGQKVMKDYTNVFNSLQKVNVELHRAYSDMEDQIVDSNNYSKEEFDAYSQGDLSLLNKEGKPLFNPEEMAAIIEYNKDPANEKKKAKIVELVHGMGGTQKAQDYAKAAAVAGFFAMQGLAPTDLKANTLSSSGVTIENTVDISSSSDKQDEFRLVFNAETTTKVEGDSLTLLGKKREVLATKTPTQLGLDANTPLKMKTGTKYKLVNAKERLDANGDGKIKVWDGFPGKKIFCLVEIDLNTEGVFKLAEDTDDNLYAAYLDGEELCWNRILPPEEAPDNGQFDEPETPPKKIERENNLVAKRGLESQWFLENPVTRTEQLIGRCVEIEEFNLDKYGGNSPTRITKLYLVKQVDGSGNTYWKIVDGDADFSTYYPINNIVKGRFTEGYNGLNGTSYTVPVPEDLKGTEKEIKLASELLGLDVRK